MKLEDVIHNAVKVQRQESLKSSPQLSLGEIIAKLEGINDKSLRVYFAFEDAMPTHFDSWRGSYEELALSFKFEGDAQTVEDLLQKCREAVGAIYTGYKGGDFTMGRNTPVWVANYGNSGNTGIVDVFQTEYMVILKTGYCEL